MQLRSRFLLFAVFVALTHAGTASGQVFSEQDTMFDLLICEPPISTCSFGPGPDDTRFFPVPGLRDDCPPGYSCTCVPSCPICTDWDAQVCIPDPSRRCNTACDCEPGLGCFDGRCIAGFAPVFCCDSDICPADEQCQRRNGEMARCGRDSGDPVCRERIDLVVRAIRKIVEKNSRCRDDSDCVVIDSRTECVGSCGVYVNRRRADRVKPRIERLDRKICGDFEEDGCTFEPVFCLAVILQPSCVDNRCTGAFSTGRPLVRSGESSERGGDPWR